MITKGQKIPSVAIKQVTAEGIADVDPAALFAGKKAIMFSLPGAFTPTCSQKHLPGYLKELAQLNEKLDGEGVGGRNPVNGPRYLAAVRRVAPPGCRVVGAGQHQGSTSAIRRSINAPVAN